MALSLPTSSVAASEAIDNATIHKAVVPGRFCPNFAYHLLVHNGWPTQNDVLEDFSLLVLMFC
jgi:hypothetical protein